MTRFYSVEIGRFEFFKPAIFFCCKKIFIKIFKILLKKFAHIKNIFYFCAVFYKTLCYNSLNSIFF